MHRLILLPVVCIAFCLTGCDEKTMDYTFNVVKWAQNLMDVRINELADADTTPERRAELQAQLDYYEGLIERRVNTLLESSGIQGKIEAMDFQEIAIEAVKTSVREGVSGDYSGVLAGTIAPEATTYTFEWTYAPRIPAPPAEMNTVPFVAPTSSVEPVPDGAAAKTDPMVRQLQAALVARGAPIPVDGIPGPATESAVKAFQESAGLTADGIAGEKTWAALGGRRAGSTTRPGIVRP